MRRIICNPANLESSNASPVRAGRLCNGNPDAGVRGFAIEVDDGA